MKTIIVDIDGTLANIEHRRYLVEGDKKDWNKFKSEANNDAPNEWCVVICDSFYSNPYGSDVSIIFVSGREEKYRKLTQMQIVQWTTIFNYKLFLRKDNDYRKDAEVKKEIYEEHIKDKYNILFAIDDSKEIVDLWRSFGITTLDCCDYNRNELIEG